MVRSRETYCSPLISLIVVYIDEQPGGQGGPRCSRTTHYMLGARLCNSLSKAPATIRQSFSPFSELGLAQLLAKTRRCSENDPV